MKTSAPFVQPRAIDLPVATPPLAAWSLAAVCSGQRRPDVVAGDGLVTVLRGADRASRLVFGSASDPP